MHKLSEQAEANLEQILSSKMIEGNNNEHKLDRTTDRRHVSIGDAASILGVSIDTVRRWEKAGKLYAERLDGKNRYFEVGQLEEFITSRPMSSTEVAKLLKVSASTVRRLDAEGKLTAHRSNKGKRLYDRTAVSAYTLLLANKNESQTNSRGVIGTVLATMSEVSSELDTALHNELETIRAVEHNEAGNLLSGHIQSPISGRRVAFYLLVLSFGVLAMLANVKIGPNDTTFLSSIFNGQSSEHTSKAEDSVLQGFAVGQEPENLVVLPVTGLQIKDGGVESADIAIGAISMGHFSLDVHQALSRKTEGSVTSGPVQGPQGGIGSQGIQGLQGIQGVQGEQGIQGPAGPGSSIPEIIAGQGLVGGGSIGQVSLSLQNCSAVGQILKWNGATWGCDSSFSSFSGTWGVANGGTGNTSSTINGLLYGAGTAALQSTGAGAGGQIILANASGTPTFTTVSGDASLLTSGVLTLSSTGVVASTYGSSTHVPVFTVDAKGRITGVSNTTITGVIPGGSATGDLSGVYPNPGVVKINGNSLGSTTVTPGNILLANGGQWVSATVSGDITVSGSGVATVQANTVSLGNDTTGNYVASLTSGSGISLTGTAGEAWAPSVAVLFGSAANTVAQGNTLLSFIGSGNLTGSISGTAGGGISTNTLDVVSSPTFSTVTASIFTGALVGNASKATALQFNPTDCLANQFATSIDTGANLACTSVNKSVLGYSGTLGFTWADNEISDILTVGALGTVADAALSGNVTKLGLSIQNSEVDDDLTISASGSVADGALSMNVTKLGSSIDLATAEVVGDLRAESLQSAAVDLGAADVTVNLSNSNGAFNTNLILDGSVTAGNFIGPMSGNASTATALAADPSDCSTNTFANAIANNGNLTCSDVNKSSISNYGTLGFSWSDAEVSDALTLSASAIVADGALSVNVTKLGNTIDLATSEVSGQLRATNLQIVAADLGAADVNINLSNNNGAFNTNLTLDGIITAANFSGALSGNASTATALAANPTDCAVNQFANAVAADGDLTCAIVSKNALSDSGTLGFSWSDSEVSNTLTSSSFIGSGSTTNAIDLATAEIAGVLADGNVSNTLTVDAASTVADAALSVNITKLGTTIQNAEVDDDLTISAAGSVADGALSANVSKLGSLIDLVTEITGKLLASSLQSAATDLGAADVNVNLSNTNGSFNTNLTVDGIISAGSFSGALSGNATTASALVANPTDCIADTYATAINAGGNLTCSTVTDAALSANVTKLGLTITKDEITDAGVLGFTWADSEISDTLTIGALSTVADAALSGNITKLGSSIQNTEVDDDLTISASGNVADGALSVNVSKLGSTIDLASSEVSGLLRASNLQGGAADLGAANVEVVLSNSNGSFVTNLTTDGSVTAASFIGSLNGNANTATALSANPSDCTADTYVTSIVASGNLTCSTVSKTGLANSGSLAFTWSDSEISNTLTASILVGYDSATSAVDLATSEVSGDLRATNLQNAAADLGAANVTVNLGNTNGTFNTNLTIDGNITSDGNINTTGGVLQLNGADINTAGTLSNVAYENQANTFTVASSFTAAGTALSITNSASVGGNLAVGSLRIGTSATAGYVLTTDASGNATWQAQEIQAVYNGTTLTSGNNIIWTGKATVTGGVATIYLTNTGLSGGTALFPSTIFSVNVTGVGGSSIITSPIGNVRSISPDRKTLVISLMVGVTVPACNGVANCPAINTLANAPDGTEAYISIIGN